MSYPARAEGLVNIHRVWPKSLGHQSLLITKHNEGLGSLSHRRYTQTLTGYFRGNEEIFWTRLDYFFFHRFKQNFFLVELQKSNVKLFSPFRNDTTYFSVVRFDIVRQNLVDKLSLTTWTLVHFLICHVSTFSVTVLFLIYSNTDLSVVTSSSLWIWSIRRFSEICRQYKWFYEMCRFVPDLRKKLWWS